MFPPSSAPRSSPPLPQCLGTPPPRCAGPAAPQMHPGAEAPGEGSNGITEQTRGESDGKLMKKWCKMWKIDGKVMKSQEMIVIWQANDCHWTNGVYKYCILQDLNPRNFYVDVSFRNFIACPSKIQQVQRIGPHFAFESNIAAESKNWTGNIPTFNDVTLRLFRICGFWCFLRWHFLAGFCE